MKKFLMLFGLAVTIISAPALAQPLVYVAAGSANKIIVIDAATDEVVGQYDGIDNPHSIVSTPDGEYILSGSLKENQDAGESTAHSTIYLVHPEHGHVMLTMRAEGIIHHQTITPNGRFVISTHPTRGNISVVDLRENRVMNTVSTGPGPNYALVSSDGSKAFVSNSGNGTISEIDVETWSITRSLEGGPGPEHMVLSKDGDTIYVINPRAGSVSAVSVASGKITKTFDFGGKLHGLDIVRRHINW
ncbi:MAG: YncE family protein, partial [Rhodospirillales bacterium]|nr:YncE family protein [Rhodospirillales bacterium]